MQNLKDVVSFSGPFWKLDSRFFFTTKYKTIVSIFLFLVASETMKKKFVYYI